MGTSTGNLHVYTFGDTPGLSDGLAPRRGYSPRRVDHATELVETKKSLCRRSIDQVMFIKDVNSLAVLSGAQLPQFTRTDNPMVPPTYAL